MMMIMMVIKRKKLTANVTFLPRTLTLLYSCPRSPWRGPGEHEHRQHTRAQGSASTVSGLPGSGDKGPSSSKKPMPLVTLVCTFSPQ